MSHDHHIISQKLKLDSWWNLLLSQSHPALTEI